jgi:hypothetical protein
MLSRCWWSYGREELERGAKKLKELERRPTGRWKQSEGSDRGEIDGGVALTTENQWRRISWGCVPLDVSSRAARPAAVAPASSWAQGGAHAARVLPASVVLLLCSRPLSHLRPPCSPLICSASKEMGWTSAGARPARGLICKKKDVQWVMHKFQT